MAHIGLDLRFWRASTAGLGRYSRNLLKELLVIDQKNAYTAIITPEDEPEFNLSAPNLTKLVVPIGHYTLAEQTRLPSVLRRQSFDLVHFANFNHPLLYRGKFVVTIHDLIMHFFPTGRKKTSLWRRLAYRQVMADCRRARQIIVPSRSTKSDLIKYLNFPAEKITLIYEGSEEKFRPHSSSQIMAIRKKLNLPERFILFVSRWEAYKGLPVLLEAFGLMRQKYPDLALVICGRPSPQAPEIADQIVRKQRTGEPIITPGFLPDEDLAALYSAASVYVHPSLYEGFGIMILEAFAAGVPVVTSSSSSLPEVAGEAAVLVNPNDSAEIAKAVVSILSDKKLAEKLRHAGLERVKLFSWQKMARETLAVYERALTF